MGALAAAICLTSKGQKVLVLEQHNVPGGWCHSFHIAGHRFSPGCHYIGQLGQGQTTRELYEGLGIANELVFFEMNSAAYEHCWVGPNRIDIQACFDELYSNLSERFPAEKKGLSRYLAMIRKVSGQLALIPRMQGFWDHVTIPWRTRHLGKYGLFNLQKVINWYIKDPLLKTVLTIQWGNHGLTPDKACFPYHAAVMDHYSNGGFYPMGGGSAIVKAMTNRIKRNGGQILTAQKVARILVQGEKNKRAIGVELANGQKMYAKTIISNADPEKTYLQLIGKQHLSAKLIKQIAKTRYSCASLVLFLVVKMDVCKAGLDSGNVWVIPDTDSKSHYKKETDKSPNLSRFFISCSTLKDPTSFDGIHHTLEVITLLDNTLFDKFKDEASGRSKAYLQYKEQLCIEMIESLEKVLPGISDSIIHKELGTPLTNVRYIGSTNGCIYGTEKSFWQIGAFGYQSRSEIENLYLCGASILANGIAGATYSGVQTAARILDSTQAELLKPDLSQKLRVYAAEDASQYPDWIKRKISQRKGIKDL
ncbi:NAD(P)/FAD-dependent oxidoreductase [Dyadobacter sediminis]|uniref:NAD(P)/FAD-dependent oxidoreductase n=2 Tax=Dyadobacter sediminis TaxID=1493691 RepID=A0A5R9KMT2_9BACT|nr:NAD(P)/FAD-dependent oxidoreductase [Dyadobacter sediminis]